MKSSVVVFFLSMGLLALGANLPETFGQEGTGDPPNAPSNSIALPLKTVLLPQKNTLKCLARGFPPEDTKISWYYETQPMAASDISSSNPSHQGKVYTSSSLVVDSLMWSSGRFSCVVEYKVPPAVSDRKATDKSMGKPPAFEKSHVRTRSHEDGAEPEGSIRCSVAGRRPQGLTIKWFENTRPYTGNVLYKNKGPAATSTITVDNVAEHAGTFFGCLLEGKTRYSTPPED